ncbi:FAD-dependent thymidylate synthase [Rhizobium leguminosarum]|uniref:Flavin-dependent thymidylate synthase n=1 Tax=Rhizobium leguminosarum TaxID=384 RepID=A0ABD7PK40_RHILE|nr:FAD-dependent thymidylate synthase [Rhizobium leguminosarum]TAV64754.1 FAD-dependent thymidylate synthase [Rhizobium leguminosarum]TAV65212.1 FAD-dependent thymidylate synthase [Rhizobium leguminosarum]TAW25201.1 FAD-dependent thymidylate synthase [Rhizobium leguminosarum]TAW27963.1 FAD-dependent thymidylate synthase [Rhizobium leguminosarum]TAZ22663.1 FAD-dependent thymidylate synthase [Rhizobium leguminosarum]
MSTLSDEQKLQIQQSRGTSASTRRAVSPGLEEILYEAFPVLDHGFVRVVDYMGDDSAVVQAARVSYGRGTRQVSEDRGLINYLLRHWHTTPFEMAEIKLHVKMPIFVARQWIRHRMANVNEYSARYSILDREFYIPEPAQLAAQSVQNRQGRGEVVGADEAKRILDLLTEDSQRSYDHYLDMLNHDETGKPIDEGRQGLARELARMNLSLNFYTQWYWKTDLHNLMNFLRLRADKHAQYEIRIYADVILDILQKWVPLTFDAFREHRLEAASFSGEAVKALRRMLAGETLEQSDTAMSKREWDEFQAVLANQ